VGSKDGGRIETTGGGTIEVTSVPFVSGGRRERHLSLTLKCGGQRAGSLLCLHLSIQLGRRETPTSTTVSMNRTGSSSSNSSNN
jgi:hypothetical protein